ncbi:hypothetical protein [Actinomadura oligospora]|uniref:hypothetical protein n=1 Tax=Actinomadura oligospora TaxID=111804 RepID=UPI00047E1620|nr:hypothetical protein [Actinomadura oligospora]
MNGLVLVLVGLVLMAVGVVAGLVVLAEWAETRRAVRWGHTIGRHCGRASCEPCAIAAQSAEAATEVGARPVLIVPVMVPWPPPIPGAFTQVI